jgi:ribonuclease BN (tRNA processing enzyme)
MRVTFVGSGDAFGSGGRFNTCFHVETSNGAFLIDCGATSLVAMKRLNIDRNAIDTILITHFHGDHFGGIPYFILDAQFFTKRLRPLKILGPRGLSEWYEKVMEVTFPGSAGAKRKFDLELRELPPGKTELQSGLEIQPALVHHGQPGGPFFAYRVQTEGKIIAYTGDTEWCDTLIDIGRDADLLIAEAYFHSKKAPLHLDLATLEAKLPHIRPKRLILTHMSDDMLSRLGNLEYETAADGLCLEI